MVFIPFCNRLNSPVLGVPFCMCVRGIDFYRGLNLLTVFYENLCFFSVFGCFRIILGYCSVYC